MQSETNSIVLIFLGRVKEMVAYRPAAIDDDRRPVAVITIQELIAFVRPYPKALEEPDAGLGLAWLTIPDSRRPLAPVFSRRGLMLDLLWF